MSNVLLVVDMIVGFLEPGHNLFCGDKARDIIPNVQELIDREMDLGSEVIFINDGSIDESLNILHNIIKSNNGINKCICWKVLY